VAVSKVAIANRALQMLGAARIESLTQDTPNARSMNAAYDPVRLRLLRKYDWGFAIKRTSIAADGDPTEWGGLNRFTLPNDYVRLLRDDESGDRLDWKIEGRYIVTKDAAPLKIKYIANITTATMFDVGFDEALAAALALDTCEEITQSTSKKQGLYKDFEDALDDAGVANAKEKDAQVSLEDDWVLARI
jgi:hypothetical protein